MSWIQTHGGGKFDLQYPNAGSVDIDDIAHALSHLCRYTGHCNRFYSVASHSLLVATLVPEELQLQGLLHDATEAYVGDVSSPLKQMLPEYKRIEARVWAAIAERFGVPEKLAPEVKHADCVALMIERAQLLGESPEPWAPELEAIAATAPKPYLFQETAWQARMRFKNKFHLLTEGKFA